MLEPMDRPPVPITTHGEIDPDRLAEVARFVADQRITEHVVRDVLAADLRIDEIIEMDEFTIDLVVPLPDGLTLVYDTT